MKRKLKISTALTLVLLMIMNLFAAPSIYALEMDAVQVTANEDDKKQISSSKVKVTMNDNGHYALMLRNPDATAFYNGETSSSSNIDVAIGNTITSWYNLTLENFYIEGNKIKMSRIYSTEDTQKARFTLILSIVNATLEGGFMKVEIQMENLSESSQELGAFIYWDTMINGNDASPFEVISNGWRNYYGDFQVSAFFKDTMHVTNADAIWMGKWGSGSKGWLSNPPMTWENHAEQIGQIINSTDTAAGAWYDPIHVSAGASRTISTIIGAGPKNEPPSIGDIDLDELKKKKYLPGDPVTIRGTATDSDEVGNTAYLMGTINNEPPEQLEVLDLSSETAEFDAIYYIPSDLPEGEHILQFWIMDSTGGTSGLQQVVIIVLHKYEIENRIVKGGTEISITSGAPSNSVVAWLAPEHTSSFVEGPTMTKLTGNGTSATITAPSDEGEYKLYTLDAIGDIKGISNNTVIVDNTPPSKPSIEAQHIKGSAQLTLTETVPQAGETAWLAPSGTTQFAEGATMTKLVGDGQLAIITAPANDDSYKLFLVDEADNISEESDEAIIVDNTAPDVIDISLSTVDWTNQDVVINVQFNDASGSDITTTKYAAGEYTINNFPSNGLNIVDGQFTVSQNGNYTIYVEDALGNARVIPMTIDNIDKNEPSNPIITRLPESDFFNAPYTVTIEAGHDGAGESGIEGTYYQLSGAVNEPWQVYTEPFTIDEQGTTTIEVKSVDYAGNESVVVSRTININSSIVVFPSLHLSPDKRYSNENIAVSISKTFDEAYSEEADAADVYYRLSDDADFLLYVGPFTISNEGDYSISVKVIDRYSNESVISKTITVDKTAPTSQNNRLTQSEQTVQSSGTIALSSSQHPDVDGTDTLWLAPAGTTVFVKGNNMVKANGDADSIALPQIDGEYYLFVVDQAGNVSAGSIEKLIVDNTPPEVTISGERNNDGIYLQYPTITFTEGTVVLNGTVIESGETVTQNGTYTLIATDAVGNTVTIHFTVRNDLEIVTKDKAALEIGYADDNNENWVTEKLTLPTTGANGATIEWSSSHSDIVTDNGMVTEPATHTTVTLTATISSGDEVTEKQFTIRVMSDPVPPELQLIGSANVTVEQNSLYVEQGASAVDARDGDLTASVEILGFVNTAKLGSYILTYKVTDSNGNEVEVPRSITVVEKIITTDAIIPASSKESLADAKLASAIQAAARSTNKIVKIAISSDVEVNKPVIVTLSKAQAALAKQQHVHLILETPSASIEVPSSAIDTSLLTGNERLALVIEQVDISLPQHTDMIDAIQNINSTIDIYDGKIYDFMMKIVKEDNSGHIVEERVIESFQSAEDIKLRIFVGNDAAAQEAFMTFYYNTVQGEWEYIRSSLLADSGYIELLTNHLSIYSVMHMSKSEKQEEMAKVLNKAGITINEALQVLEDPDMDFESEAVTKYNTLTRKHTETVAQHILDAKPVGGFNYASLRDAYSLAVTDKQDAISNDIVEPVIQLNGKKDIYIYYKNSYVEPGATALDDQDGDITGRIVVHGTVDTSVIGQYQLKYTVTDLNGNTSEMFRTVHVIHYPVIDNMPDADKEDLDAYVEVITGQKNIKVTPNAAEEAIASQLPTGMKLIGTTFTVTGIGADSETSGTIRIKYDPATVGNEDRIAVYVFDEAVKAWKVIGGIVNKANHTIEVEVTAPSTVAVMEYNVTFKDMDNHWAKDIVELLAAKQIITGDQYGYFHPNQGITRAEFATLIVKTLQLPLENVSAEFNDIDGSAWYASYIATARKAGVVKGVSETEFKPAQIVTRQEMTAMVVRAYSLVEELPSVQESLNDQQQFADSRTISQWALEDVYIAKHLQLIQGRSNNVFAPKDDTLRGEAAALIYQLLLALKQI